MYRYYCIITYKNFNYSLLIFCDLFTILSQLGFCWTKSFIWGEDIETLLKGLIDRKTQSFDEEIHILQDNPSIVGN